MPNITASIEYLFGGAQIITLFMLTLSARGYTTIDIDEATLATLAFLSLAYPIGIIVDNFAYLPKKFIVWLNKTMKTDTDFSHEDNFLKLLSTDPRELINRAKGFELSKRLMRITSLNSLMVFAIELIYQRGNPDFTSSLILVMFALFLSALITYFLISSTYHNYLEKVTR